MSLDIYTNKGKSSLLQEEQMINNLKEKWKNKEISFIQTPKKEPADCDGFMIKNDEIIGLYESKCRNLTLNQLTHFGSWLITFDKLEKCRALSYALKVPFIGFLYLVPDDITLMWKIADMGEYCIDFETKETETQMNINGGTIIRANSYLLIKDSKIV